MISAFGLKIIALITMFIDHFGYIIYDGNFSFLNYIGRIAFPIFAFQISEGYLYTKDLKKYFLRLIVFAFISQIPFMLFHSISSNKISLNIFFTLTLGLLCILIYDKLKYKSIGILFSTFIAFIAQITNCDYGFFGVAIILIFYIFKDQKLNMTLFFIICTGIRFFILIIKNGHIQTYSLLFISTIISIIPILLYNNKKGINIKYLLYLFYPLHLLALYFIYKFNII